METWRWCIKSVSWVAISEVLMIPQPWMAVSEQIVVWPKLVILGSQQIEHPLLQTALLVAVPISADSASQPLVPQLALSGLTTYW